MSSRKRSVWRAASMAMGILALTNVLSSCIIARPWHRRDWDRHRDNYQNQRYDDNRDRPRGDFDRD